MGVHRSAARRLACVAGALALLAAGCSRSTTAPLNQRLTGTVLDPSGAPARYADVWAQTLFAIGGLIQVRRSAADAEGRFDFGPVERLDWIVFAGGPRLIAADTVRYPAHTAELHLVTAGAARGRVLAPFAATPEGTLVFSDAQNVLAVSDSLGRYEVGGLPPGGWWIYFARPRVARDTVVRVVIAAPGDTVTVPDVVLSPATGAPGTALRSKNSGSHCPKPAVIGGSRVIWDGA